MPAAHTGHPAHGQSLSGSQGARPGSQAAQIPSTCTPRVTTGSLCPGLPPLEQSPSCILGTPWSWANWDSCSLGPQHQGQVHCIQKCSKRIQSTKSGTNEQQLGPGVGGGDCCPPVTEEKLRPRALQLSGCSSFLFTGTRFPLNCPLSLLSWSLGWELRGKVEVVSEFHPSSVWGWRGR